MFFFCLFLLYPALPPDMCVMVFVYIFYVDFRACYDAERRRPRAGWPQTVEVHDGLSQKGRSRIPPPGPLN